jgi:hypothetical protein
MREQLSPRQLLTALESGKTNVMLDPKQPKKVICQVSRVGDMYYLAGPLFSDYTSIELEPLFAVARQYKDDEAATVAMLNKYLGDHGMPADAQVYTCTGLQDAIDTLAGLFAAYSLHN